MSCHTSCHQLNVTYEFSWFNNNNSATIKDMKNLFKNELYWADNPTDKISATPPMKDKRKYSFLVSLYSKYKTLVPNILNIPLTTVLKQLFINCSWRELLENVYYYTPSPPPPPHTHTHTHTRLCGFWTTAYWSKMCHETVKFCNLACTPLTLFHMGSFG